MPVDRPDRSRVRSTGTDGERLPGASGTATPGASATRLLSELDAAFADRALPERLHGPTMDVPDDVAEVEAFEHLDRSGLDCAHLERHPWAISLFSPDAFLHFLPRILAAGVREHRTDLLVQDFIVSELDRSPSPERWDDHFASRWTRLSRRECEAVQAWLLWMAEAGWTPRFESTFDRAFDTLSLLADAADAPD